MRYRAIGDHVLKRVEVSFDGLQLEHDGGSRVAMRIGHPVLAVAVAKPEFPKEAVRLAAPHHLEKQQALSVVQMLSNGAVAAPILHIPTLALAVVVENASVIPEVVVAMLLASFASEQDDEGTIGWGGNAALRLAAKPTMDIPLAVVERANLVTDGKRVCSRHGAQKSTRGWIDAPPCE